MLYQSFCRGTGPYQFAMKRIVSSVLSVIMLFTLVFELDFSVFADEYSGVCGENVSYSFDKMTCMLEISGSGDMFDYEPEKAPWSQYRKSIKSVVISDGVTSIGDSAFWDCNGLLTAKIADSVMRIEMFAFYQCTELNAINLPDKIKEINDYTFYECYDLKNIYVPDNVVSIGEYAFYSCRRIESLYLPDGLEFIGESAFQGCRALKELILPESIKHIGALAFTSCELITEVNIPHLLDKISAGVFSHCTALTNIKIHDHIKSVGNYAFYGCKNLTDIYWSKKLISIGNYAFYECDGLMELLLPDGLLSIGDYAFGMCQYLADISIPDTVTDIGSACFKNCFNLTAVIIPEKVSAISDNLFYGCYKLENVILSDDIISIGDSAFESCINLNSILLPESLVSVGNSAFKHCMDLTEIFISQNVAEINESAFYECFDLSDVYYAGSEEKWNKIAIGNGNNNLLNATVHYQKQIDLTNFIIKTVSLSLESSITMNFKMLKSAVDGFENPYMVFKCGNDELTVADYTEQGDYYVFSYQGISPQLMNDDVTAVLHATHNGIDYVSPEKVMSVRTYAYTMLERYHTDDYAKIRTLLVDLLNYGAASQKYVGYQTDNLVNAALTDEQKAWGTSAEPVFENIRDYNYKTIDSPTSEWVGSGLVLNNSVTVRAKFTADSIENKTVVITCGKGTFTYSADDFVQDKDGNYYVYCNEIFANEMSEEILMTVYDNGVPCSNTMRFSIESYAKLVHDSYAGTALDELTTAMMRYGNSAEALGA